MISQLKTIVTNDNIKIDEPMSQHTTFRIGGSADCYLAPGSVEELINIMELCHKENITFQIVGNGSNLLVGDKGIRGVVIQFQKAFSKIECHENKIKVQSGALLSAIANAAYENSLSGMEFASGIPGTIGGAVVMNAGAYGGEMKDIIHSVTVLTEENKIEVLSKEELDFGYRKSCILGKKYIVIEAEILLHQGDKSTIKERMDELKELRVSKQPIEYPSAGSTFKRPEGYFAGKLIMDAGLAGYKIGGAQVSQKHCGFVINSEKATAKDVLDLIEYVKQVVSEKYEVTLEPEVKMLGEF